MMAFGSCSLFLFCSGGPLMAFGTCSDFVLAPEVLSWPSAPALYFFLLRRSSHGLRQLLLFLFCSRGPLMAFGTCSDFVFASEVL